MAAIDALDVLVRGDRVGDRGHPRLADVVEGRVVRAQPVVPPRPAVGVTEIAAVRVAEDLVGALGLGVDDPGAAFEADQEEAALALELVLLAQDVLGVALVVEAHHGRLEPLHHDAPARLDALGQVGQQVAQEVRFSGQRMDLAEDLGDDPQGALGTDEESREVRTARVAADRQAPEEVAAGQDDLQLVDHVAHLPVLRRQDAAAVGGDEAAQGRGVDRGGEVVHRVATRGQRLLEVSLQDARLHAHRERALVDGEDAVHPLGVDDDAAPDRQGAARVAGPAAPRHDGHVTLVGEADDGLDLLARPREDDGSGSRQPIGPVELVAGHPPHVDARGVDLRGVGDDAIRAHDGLQVASGGRASSGGGEGTVASGGRSSQGVVGSWCARDERATRAGCPPGRRCREGRSWSAPRPGWRAPARCQRGRSPRSARAGGRSR